MNQLEIQFFWPLTEQVPLDLDYTDCSKPQLSTIINGPSNLTFYNGNSSSVSVVASKLSLDVDTTVFKVKEEPNIVRRAIFKILGIKWEKK